MVDWRGVTPQPQPVKPGDDLDSGKPLDDAERAWLKGNRWPARRRVALLLGLAVAVTVSLLASRRLPR
jgi:hypothetical protein